MFICEVNLFLLSCEKKRENLFGKKMRFLCGLKKCGFYAWEIYICLNNVWKIIFIFIYGKLQ